MNETEQPRPSNDEADESSRLEELTDAGGNAPLLETLDSLPSTGLLSFYDRLRHRVARTLGRRAGKLGDRAASALLLVPDVFILLLRLSLDKEVPKATRATLASTLAYFILPIDLLPEAVLGPVAYLDDLVLALSALSSAFGKDLEPYAAKYWNGAQPLRTVIGDITSTASSLLGDNLYDRLRHRLARQGIRVDDAL